MDADVLTTRVVDGIAVITLGTERRIYIDQETSDALFEALSKCAGDPDIRVVIVTGAAPGSFVRHYSIPELIRFAESVRATGREWPEARFIDGPISVCESMPKPVIAAISGTCLAGAFELMSPAMCASPRTATTRLASRKRTLDFSPVPAARKGCHAPSERQPRS